MQAVSTVSSLSVSQGSCQTSGLAMREEGKRNHTLLLWLNTGSVCPQPDVHLCSGDVIFAIHSVAATGAVNLGR
jgi:hypothetical protein